MELYLEKRNKHTVFFNGNINGESIKALRKKGRRRDSLGRYKRGNSYFHINTYSFKELDFNFNIEEMSSFITNTSLFVEYCNKYQKTKIFSHNNIAQSLSLAHQLKMLDDRITNIKNEPHSFFYNTYNFKREWEEIMLGKNDVWFFIKVQGYRNIQYSISPKEVFKLDYNKLPSGVIELFMYAGIDLKIKNLELKTSLFKKQKEAYTEDKKQELKPLITSEKNPVLFVENHSKCYLMTDSNTRKTKIGKSVNPKYREKTLQSEKPTITLFCIFDENIETLLHNKYKTKRFRGEWFDLTDNDISAILLKNNHTII